MYIPNQRQESYPFSIAGKPIFHTWKNNFTEEETELSTRGKYRLLIQEVCALPYPRLSAA